MEKNNKNHTVVFATTNQGKLREIREILKDLNMEVISMAEAGFTDDIEENGTTFSENAEIKARAVWEKVKNVTVLADDSGLAIDCLNGEPGVYSARYLGDTPYSEKNLVLIDRVNQTGKDRAARFICAIAAVLPDGQVLHTEASMEGEIAEEPAGNGGFGYDPILYLPEFGKTSAELTMEEKNRISHRGKALEQMKAELRKTLGSVEL